MGLNWGEFFTRAGSGLGDYASYLYRRQDDERDREREDRRDKLEEKRVNAGIEQSRLENIREDRKALRDPAEKEAERLADLGIHSPDFVQNSMQSRLPDATQAIPDAGSMVIGALRSAGREGVDRVYREGPAALEQAYAGKGLSAAMPGGGMAVIEPSVRATLESAASSRASAEASRQQARELALLRIGKMGKSPSDPLAAPRMKFITDRAAELMKPQMDERGFRVIGPGKSQAEAFKLANDEWELAKGGIQTEEPEPVDLPDSTGGSPKLAEAGMGSFGAPSTPLSAMEPEAVEAVRKELSGDEEQDRADLVQAGYSDEEIELLLGQ